MPIFRAMDHVLVRPVDDEVVLLNLDDGTCFSLNQSGRALWERIKVGATEAELTDLLAGTYDVDAADAARDVATLLAELVRTGLVTEDAS